MKFVMCVITYHNSSETEDHMCNTTEEYMLSNTLHCTDILKIIV